MEVEKQNAISGKITTIFYIFMSTLFVKIGRSLKSGKSIQSSTERAWKIDPQKAASITRIVGVDKAEAKGVFKVIRYYYDPEGSGRICFDLEEEKNQKKWIGVYNDEEFDSYRYCRCAVRYYY